MLSLKDRILETLVSHNLLTEEQLMNALQVQRAKGGRLQDILVEQGFVQEADLLAALSEGLGIPPINLSRLKINPDLKKFISRDMARHYQVLPVACMGQTLSVVMSDPLNLFALDTLTTSTGLSVSPFLAGTNDIQEAIDRYYGSGIEDTLREIQKTTEDLSIEVLGEGPERAPAAEELFNLVQELPVVRLTDALLTKAVRLRASDLLIEPMETRLRVRYRVDGMLQEGESPPKQMQQAVVSRIKILSELNIAERRLPQDGHFQFSVEDRTVDFRVSVLPTQHGEKACLRLLDKSQIRLDLDTLGFLPEDLAKLKQAAEQPHGLLLTTGPTGSGKTTTLYAMLQLIHTPEKNLVTVEDPVEFDLPGINQVNAKAEIGLTFARALRSILRQDPDVIMVGEIRDSETADMAVKSALTGHLVLTTLHTNTAVGSIVRLVNMGIEPFLLNSCLLAVIGQRLVRKLCNRCRQTYELPAALAGKLGLVDAHGKPVPVCRAAPKGCNACSQSGYRGREVIAEVLMLTPQIRELIVRRAQEREIEAAAREAGMRTLREHAIQKVRAHLTTVDELFRTTIGEVVEPRGAEPRKDGAS